MPCWPNIMPTKDTHVNYCMQWLGILVSITWFCFIWFNLPFIQNYFNIWKIYIIINHTIIYNKKCSCQLRVNILTYPLPACTRPSWCSNKPPSEAGWISSLDQPIIKFNIYLHSSNWGLDIFRYIDGLNNISNFYNVAIVIAGVLSILVIIIGVPNGILRSCRCITVGCFRPVTLVSVPVKARGTSVDLIVPVVADLEAATVPRDRCKAALITSIVWTGGKLQILQTVVPCEHSTLWQGTGPSKQPPLVNITIMISFLIMTQTITC